MPITPSLAHYEKAAELASQCLQQNSAGVRIAHDWSPGGPLVRFRVELQNRSHFHVTFGSDRVAALGGDVNLWAKEIRQAVIRRMAR